ncbi:MAG: rubrerythrin [Candidatus Omnitrophica bacterium]|nr:rubrerythrin [Candidatus Omnitrophota bacterium]
MYFHDLTEAQVLALAISAEEEDGHIYRDFAEALRKDFPVTADLFVRMSKEESGHRSRLISLYQKRFGEHIPLIRRQDVKGFVTRRPFWFMHTVRPDKAREEAASMELEARRFYEVAAQRTNDASMRKLLGDLAQEEQQHASSASQITQEKMADGGLMEESNAQRRLFVLRFIQPGLAGLMDGSVSTLAPIFAAAFATSNTLETLKVGLAASVGAGISMGFAEALSDDGKLSGRGSPWLRGVICGIMTTLGGLGHTVPFFLRDFHAALTIAIAVVIIELGAISCIRWKYMDTPFLAAAFQVVVGGLLVFFVGWFVGAS